MSTSTAVFGIQFHPEVSHTPQGRRCSKTSSTASAAARPRWTMGAFVEEAVARIRAQVGDGRVICGLSGGVDSAVAALLVHRAIGDRLDLHLRRYRLHARGRARSRSSRRSASHFDIELVARGRQRALSGAAGGRHRSRAEAHRSSAKSSSTSSRREAEQLRADGPIAFLAQGTLYPDVIESASARRQRRPSIKTHHNVGGLPEDMALRSWSSRCATSSRTRCARLGRELGLPEDRVWRHPFPGPGLAVRCIGEVTRARLDDPAPAPTPSCSRRCAARACIARSARPSPCCCRCRASA